MLVYLPVCAEKASLHAKECLVHMHVSMYLHCIALVLVLVLDQPAQLSLLDGDRVRQSL